MMTTTRDKMPSQRYVALPMTSWYWLAMVRVWALLYLHMRRATGLPAGRGGERHETAGRCAPLGLSLVC